MISSVGCLIYYKRSLTGIFLDQRLNLDHHSGQNPNPWAARKSLKGHLWCQSSGGAVPRAVVDVQCGTERLRLTGPGRDSSWSLTWIHSRLKKSEWYPLFRGLWPSTACVELCPSLSFFLSVLFESRNLQVEMDYLSPSQTLVHI